MVPLCRLGHQLLVCWLQPSMLNVASRKMQSTTQGSGGLPAEWSDLCRVTAFVGLRAARSRTRRRDQF